MSTQKSTEKEPAKLRIILPLVAVILLLTGLIAMINLSKSPFAPMTTPELNESFAGYISKLKSRDHYPLFVSHKKVIIPAGAALHDSLKDIEGSDLISNIELNYNIPVSINLTGDWLFTLKDTDFIAQGPFPLFGEAVLDSSQLQVTFKSELAEDKKAVLKDALKETLASYQMSMDATTQVALEQESHAKVQDFLESWLKSTFKNLPDLKYQIRFIGSKNSDNGDEP